MVRQANVLLSWRNNYLSPPCAQVVDFTLQRSRRAAAFLNRNLNFSLALRVTN